MRAVMYARYSTDKQTELSIEAQFRACREYAQVKGYIITGQYEDKAISGKSTVSRSGYQKMVRDAEAGKFDIILIHKYDRIARNLGDHVNLEKRLQGYGVQLIAVAQEVESNKEGKLIKTMLWGMSEYYIDNLAEESRKGHKEIALKAMHNGGVAPFGYDVVDQQYVINPIEAEYVRRMFDACINRTGYKPIVEELHDKGIKGHRGKELTNSSIYEILKNEKYCGTYLYSPIEEKDRKERRTKPNAIRVYDAFPAIVDYDTYNKAQAVMAQRKWKRRSKYWCSGIVYCECGAPMYAQTSTKGNFSRAYYVCSAKCGARTVPAWKVDKMVEIYLSKLFSDENKKEISEMLAQAAQDDREYQRTFEEEKRKKLEEINLKIENSIKNLQSGILPAAAIEVIGKSIEDLQKEKEVVSRSKPVKFELPEMYEGWIDRILAAKHDELPKLLVDRITVKEKSAELKSRFADFLGSYGCGGTHPVLPKILTYISMAIME